MYAEWLTSVWTNWLRRLTRSSKRARCRAKILTLDWKGFAYSILPAPTGSGARSIKHYKPQAKHRSYWRKYKLPKERLLAHWSTRFAQPMKPADWTRLSLY